MALGANRSANMSSGLLLDHMPSPSSEPVTVGPRFRPYASPNHHVTKGRYITSNDPRGYIPVHEYPLNGQWIMLDMDDGYVLWTGIWKALGNSKADIVKIVESQPDLASQLRRVRGGYLKIQGTWMPYETALRLARLVAWPIRYDLVPLFGPTFPSTCLSPDQPGYGQIVKPGSGKRRSRRTTQNDIPPDSRHEWTVISPTLAASASTSSASTRPQAVNSALSGRELSHSHQYQAGSPVMLHVPYAQGAYHTPPPMNGLHSPYAQAHRHSPPLDIRTNIRYSPYPSSLSSPPAVYEVDVRPMHFESIKLPSIQPPTGRLGNNRSGSFTLPPISSLDLREGQRVDDSFTILRRLRSDDDADVAGGKSTVAQALHRRCVGPPPEYSTGRQFSQISDLTSASPSAPSTSSSNRSGGSRTGASSRGEPAPHLAPFSGEARHVHMPVTTSSAWEQRAPPLPPSARQADNVPEPARHAWRPW
ncbi:hypothetical protein SCP_1800780 [Sparassis crispa]|uniref:HTH APSES-type domain-containing protein n=1 Tax=Sparassis crispa TaxID=139825 RepID=A0A401H6I5_9APHY|nr:hypothetical protein SCP_1800780 [Sparassis crispa]GBE90056.1 hypothetical protein SCP_1800780 [Sparassis crispa]